MIHYMIARVNRVRGSTGCAAKLQEECKHPVPLSSVSRPVKFSYKLRHKLLPTACVVSGAEAAFMNQYSALCVCVNEVLLIGYDIIAPGRGKVLGGRGSEIAIM